MAMNALLEVESLRVSFAGAHGRIDAVDDINFHVGRGEILGLVGESGCGKSLSALALMGLAGPKAIVSGHARYDGVDLVAASAPQRESLRGAELAMIFQDPQSSLNPIMTVGAQIGEALALSPSSPSGRAKHRIISLLQEVGIPQPERRLGTYPHELSGGMCQRVMIAMMLAREPRLLIADEPTTALDVTVQAQILALLNALRHRHGTSIILITHDLGVVAQTCDRVAVMYAGRIIETSPVGALFKSPRHPYTRGLLDARASLLRRDPDLSVIPGIVPSPRSRPEGCAFGPRCAHATPACRVTRPSLRGATQQYACHHPLGHPPLDMTQRRPELSHA